MKDSRSCPENLLARASQDIDAVRTDERLGTHLRQCRSCRRELAMAQAFKHEFTQFAGVEALSHRVAAAVAKEVAHPSPPVRPVRRRNTGWYLFAAALALVSIAAIAAEYPRLRSLRLASSSLVDPVAIPAMSPPVASALVERASELPLPSPATSVVDDTPAEPLLAHRPAPSAQIAGTASGSSAPTARDLFTSANMARRDNNGSRASSLYRELQRRYPTSVEALVSRVSFGRVLLDQLADPSGALGQFDQYLAQTTHTALAEEALFGRATALSQLGRPEAERETWRTLVTRYPSSIYADRARVRMGAIQ